MFTIIIAAYNRSKSLERLLKSLNQAKKQFKDNINMIISLEGNASKDVEDVASKFNWKYGEKNIFRHKNKLGLVKHFLWVGDQSLKYGTILFLEDDVIVSPEIFNYLWDMIPFYENDQDVAGISLYNYMNCELTFRSFVPIEDGSDVYFFQHPYTGNVWFGKKWALFKKWLINYLPNGELIPKKIVDWDNSFKKIFIQYLVESNQYMVYPRFSLVSDMGEGGLHMNQRFNTRTKLVCAYHAMKLLKKAESISVYDAFFDLDVNCIKSLNLQLAKYNFINDINALKKLKEEDLVLTNRKVNSYIMCFDCNYKPIETGAVLGFTGDGLYLTRAKNIVESQSEYLNRCQYDDVCKYFPIRRRTALKLFVDSMVFSWHRLVSMLSKK